MRCGMVVSAMVPALLAGTRAGFAADAGSFDAARFTYLSIILVAVISSLVVAYRHRLLAAGGHLLIWLAIFAALIAGYGFRAEMKAVGLRAVSVLVPGVAVSESGNGAMAIAKSADGHFWVRTSVEGRTLRMLVDTGATTVVLSNDDARAVGLDTTKLDYSVSVSTANARTSAAAITLGEIAIGDITEKRVDAMVARPGALEVSLLGNSFLERLKSFTVEGDRLILRK